LLHELDQKLWNAADHSRANLAATVYKHTAVRQIDAQAGAIVEEGGFTERLHRIRTAWRQLGRSPKA
jgi:four helix bundle suffix protein